MNRETRGELARDLSSPEVSLPLAVGAVAALALFALLRWFLPAMLGETRPLAVLSHDAAVCAFLLLIPTIFVMREGWERRALLREVPSLDALRDLHPDNFLRLLGEFYRRRGLNVEGGPAAGVADLRIDAAEGTVLVRARHFLEASLGAAAINEIYAALVNQRAQRAIVVTSGFFTPAARRAAQGRPVDLIEGPALSVMIESVRQTPVPRASTSATLHRMPPAKAAAPAPAPPAAESAPPRSPVPAAAPAASPSAAAGMAAPSCPKCGAPMAKRVAQAGTMAGKSFWGCTRFPECRGIAVGP